MPVIQDYSALTLIEEIINAEGIPNTGVSFLSEQPAGKSLPVINESYGTFYADVHFTGAATPAQRKRAADIIAAADKRKRQPKTQDEQIADLDKLSKSDKDKAILALIAKQLEVEPLFLQRVGITYKGDKDPVAAPIQNR